MSQPVDEDKQNDTEEISTQRDPPALPRSPSPKFGTCTVCADDFIEDDDIYFLQCLHKFHSTCISKWLTVKQQCPVCKFPANIDVVGVDDQGNFISSTGQTITNGVIENVRNTEHVHTRISRAIEVLRNIHSANRSNTDMDWDTVQNIVQNSSRGSQDLDNIISSQDAQTHPDSPYPEFNSLENDSDSDSDMSDPSSLPIARPAPEIQILARQRDRLARIASSNTRQIRSNTRFATRTPSSHEYSSSSEEYIEESESSVSQPATPEVSQLQDAVEFKSEPTLAANSLSNGASSPDGNWGNIQWVPQWPSFDIHWGSHPSASPAWTASSNPPDASHMQLPQSSVASQALPDSTGATMSQPNPEFKWGSDPESKWETDYKTQPPSEVDVLDEYLISEPTDDAEDSNEEQDGQYPETPIWSD